MFHIVLFQPEIPQNTGNIIRLCANTGARLDKLLRRAGLDYHEYAMMQVHEDWPAFLAAVRPLRVFAFTTRATRSYAEADFMSGDALVFGPETRGLPAEVLDGTPEAQQLRIPMRPESRSLNLSNAVALATYEAWRQQGFADAAW
jgi:tRNA (cytidine/uridine-2'-O-)-methyltransferase